MTIITLVSLDSFLPAVANELPGVPETPAKDALRDACIDFCAETNFWQYEIPAVTATINVADYDVSALAPVDTKLCDILNVKFNGYRVDPKTRDWLDDNVGSWESIKEQVPRFFMVPQPGFIRFVGTPSMMIAAAIAMTVSIKPSRTATQVYDRLFEDYAPAITSGALSRLLAQATKPWFNPELSAAYQKDYENGRGHAKVDVNRGNTRMATYVQPRALA